MIFTILSVALFVFGIIGLVTYWEHEVMDVLSAGSLIIGSICTIIAMCGILCAASNNIDFPNEYAVNKSYIESVYTNEQLTGEERVKVVEMATETNRQILKSRSWGDNIWFGWMFSNVPGEFELIDISKIQGADQHITIETK